MAKKNKQVLFRGVPVIPVTKATKKIKHSTNFAVRELKDIQDSLASLHAKWDKQFPAPAEPLTDQT